MTGEDREVDERVAEAAADARRDAFDPNLIESPPAEDAPPLELDTAKMPPKVVPEPERVRFEWGRVGRVVKRLLLALVALVVLAAGAAAFALYTRTGRELLPEKWKTPAAKTAIQIDEKVREATGPAYYTFTNDDGVVEIVDDIEKVPKKYRERVKVTH